MTFDDDFVQIPLESGIARLPVRLIGLQWPPPDLLCIGNAPGDRDVWYYRASCSQITDREREQMTHVCRGAEYVLMASPPAVSQ